MKKHHKKSSNLKLRNPWLWLVVAIAVLFALFLLSRTLSQPPPSKSGAEPISLKKQDLDTYTRMTGTIRLDTSIIQSLNPELRKQLQQLLQMVANRELADVIARLNRMLRRRPAYEQGAMQLLIGFCYYELGQPESALKAFKTGVMLLDTLQNLNPDAARLLAYQAFNAGYLFQLYSQPESARFYYQLSRKAIQLIPVPDKNFTGILLNNLGLTLETTGDVQNARRLYLEAASCIDTTAATTDAERLKKNIHQTITKSPVGQHQS